MLMVTCTNSSELLTMLWLENSSNPLPEPPFFLNKPSMLPVIYGSVWKYGTSFHQWIIMFPIKTLSFRRYTPFSEAPCWFHPHDGLGASTASWWFASCCWWGPENGSFRHQAGALEASLKRLQNGGSEVKLEASNLSLAIWKPQFQWTQWSLLQLRNHLCCRWTSLWSYPHRWGSRVGGFGWPINTRRIHCCYRH